jgi:hypothetical protein
MGYLILKAGDSRKLSIEYNKLVMESEPTVNLPEINADVGPEESEESDHRAELIRLSNVKEIPQSEKHLRRASDKIISKLYREYIIAQREKANILLMETLIDKFSTLLEAINMVDSGEDLSENHAGEKVSCQ